MLWGGGKDGEQKRLLARKDNSPPSRGIPIATPDSKPKRLFSRVVFRTRPVKCHAAAAMTQSLNCIFTGNCGWRGQLFGAIAVRS